MEDLGTFLTILSVMIDDLCKSQNLHVPPCRGPAPALSCSEGITLSLFGQWARFSSERGFYRFAQRHVKSALPTLPDRSQFLRQELACVSLIEQVACLLAEQRPDAQEGLDQILDATGVPVRCIKRRGAAGWLAQQTKAGVAVSVPPWVSMCFWPSRGSAHPTAQSQANHRAVSPLASMDAWHPPDHRNRFGQIAPGLPPTAVFTTIELTTIRLLRDSGTLLFCVSTHSSRA